MPPRSPALAGAPCGDDVPGLIATAWETGGVILAHPPQAGELLVSTAGLASDFFSNTVIYLLDCDQDGSLGVVINRLAETSLDEVLPQWAELVCPPRRLFTGGPVSPNGAVCLARVARPREEPPGWRRVHDDVGLLHLDTPVELVRGAYSDLRIFAGYAGWRPGQLEGELVRGDWHRTQGRPEDAFASELTSLWRRVTRRLGGEEALTSTWLADPEQN